MLISLLLLSILLTSIWGIFKEVSHLTFLNEKKQKEAFYKRYVESRLAFIFERIVNENDINRDFYFFTRPPNPAFSNHPNLIASFNNEVRVVPSFSGDVIGCLYVDLNNNLALASWPLSTSKPHVHFHKEILLEDVVSIAYKFYAPYKKAQAISKKNNHLEPEENTWLSEWLQSYEQMPAIVKITVQKQSKKAPPQTFVLSFVLPKSKTYPCLFSQS